MWSVETLGPLRPLQGVRKVKTISIMMFFCSVDIYTKDTKPFWAKWVVPYINQSSGTSLLIIIEFFKSSPPTGGKSQFHSIMVHIEQ